MENFLLFLMAVVVIVILLVIARERTKGKYLGYGFKWKPIPGYKWEPPVGKGLHPGSATADKSTALQPLDQEFLQKVAKLMGPQPWTKAQEKLVAQQLNVDSALVSAAVLKLRTGSSK